MKLTFPEEVAAASLVVLLAGCAGSDNPSAPGTPAMAEVSAASTPYFPCYADVAQTQPCVPLRDMAPGARHLGMYPGGLYGDGLSTMPAPHLTSGLAQANAIVPLDTAGHSSSSGSYLFITVGFSNQKYEFCGRELAYADQCDPWTVGGRLYQDKQAGRTDPHLVFFNGAQGGHDVTTWDDYSDASWTAVANGLASRGYSENQVQVIALQTTFKYQTGDKSLKDTLASCSQDASADACRLLAGYGNILRAARQHYPNLKLAFLNSRTYGGWTVPGVGGGGNPEPFGYESGLAMKWTIGAQVTQEQYGTIDPVAGDLSFGSGGKAAWLAWSVYNWANGTTPRSDGLTWPQSKFDPDDGAHETPHDAVPRTCETDGSGAYVCGEAVAAAPLYQFYLSNQLTRCWYRNTSTPCQ